jgi:BirA family biotin operon repressor/biotin-[acetyl-CoA-carboxylase] ligase
LSLPCVGHSVGSPFIELQSVDSTNNYALAQIHANLAQPGTCFFAHEQTAGKGQRGKSWATEKGSNITLSIVLKPTFLPVLQQFWLSACVAVATHHFLSQYAGELTRIKWPNDLYWKDKKMGGILIENIVRGSGQGTWEWAVVGIGVNINQTTFPGELKNPVSLKQITKHGYDTVELAKQLCRSVDFFYNKLDQEFALILGKYNEHLYGKNEIVKLKKDNRIFEARVKGVNEAGQLIVQHAIEEPFDFGRIEWII